MRRLTCAWSRVPNCVVPESRPVRAVRRLATLAPVVAILASLASQPACLLGRDDCDQGRIVRCASATKKLECVGGEGFYSYQEVDCATEEACIVGPSGAVCAAAPAGGACQTSQGCQASLVCKSGTCQAPSAAETQECQAASLSVEAPPVGTSIVVVIPLSATSGIEREIRSEEHTSELQSL